MEYCSLKEYILEKCHHNYESIFIKEFETSKTCTYGSFGQEIRSVALYFKKEGIKERETVLLPMENTISSLALFMGAIVSNIVPVPIANEFIENELRAIVKNTNIRAIVVAHGKKKELQVEFPFPILEYETPAQNIPEVNSLGNENRLDDIAYIAFTSGSTGKPKKIAISNLNMLAEIQCMSDAYGFDKSIRHLCLLPIYHASGLYRNILLPFHVGGEVVIVSKFVVEGFWNIIGTEKINFVQVVPSILKMLVMNCKETDPDLKNGLKCIGSASAPHPVSLIELFEKSFNVQICQGYGMTEATCGITLNPFEIGKRKLGSVGKPLEVNKLIVCNEKGETLLPGEVGKIKISGDNVAKNCLNSKNETSEKQKSDWLDTGDYGNLDDDGFLWIVGRESDLIKRGGYRIAPNEIEDVICEAFPIVESAVIGVPHPILGQDIVAFITKNTNDNISSRKVISRIKTMISSFKIPSRILFIEFIPKNGVGKVDRNKLLEYYTESVGNS